MGTVDASDLSGGEVAFTSVVFEGDVTGKVVFDSEVDVTVGLVVPIVPVPVVLIVPIEKFIFDSKENKLIITSCCICSTCGTSSFDNSTSCNITCSACGSYCLLTEEILRIHQIILKVFV